MRTRNFERHWSGTIALGILAMLWSVPAMASTRNAPSKARTAPIVVNVSVNGPIRSIREALAIVARGGTIIVHPGTYRDATIVVSIPVVIIGERYPVLDGESKRQIMTVTADSVTVRGLQFRNVGIAFTED